MTARKTTCIYTCCGEADKRHAMHVRPVVQIFAANGNVSSTIAKYVTLNDLKLSVEYGKKKSGYGLVSIKSSIFSSTSINVPISTLLWPWLS